MEYFVVCNEVCQSPAKLSTVLKRKLEILWLSGSGIMDIKIKALAGEVENIKWKIWKKLRLESFFLASIYLKIKWNSRKKTRKKLRFFEQIFEIIHGMLRYMKTYIKICNQFDERKIIQIRIMVWSVKVSTTSTISNTICFNNNPAIVSQ